MKRTRLTMLPKGRQITGPERDQIATRLRDSYNQGASIRDLMVQTGRSYGWTHRLLSESGTTLRGRGGSRPRRRTNPAQVSADMPGQAGSVRAAVTASVV